MCIYVCVQKYYIFVRGGELEISVLMCLHLLKETPEECTDKLMKWLTVEVEDELETRWMRQKEAKTLQYIFFLYYCAF